MTRRNRRARVHRAPLPAPRRGWPGIIVTATLIMALWAIAAFALAAILVPTDDPECYSDGTGATVCPLTRNPDLTHLYDTRWPEVNGDWGFAIFLLAVLSAIGIGKFVLRAQRPWPFGEMHLVLNIIAALSGIGLGLLIAGPGFIDLRMLLGVTGAGLLVCIVAGLGFAYFAHALRTDHAAHVRITELRTRSRRIIAEVTDIDWDRRIGGMADRRFTVTARFAAPDAGDPGDPDDPDDPDDPGDPGVPGTPGTLGDPSDPGTPGTPGDPKDPKDPGDPKDPKDPKDPGDPSAPRCIVTGSLDVDVQHAPVVGGTVIVYADGQLEHPTGIDFLMERDPDSVLDPDAESKYFDDPAFG